MNHLSGLDRLANRFSIMRHGQSKANARGLIVSRIENDRRGDYGLSELWTASRRSRWRGAAACPGTRSFAHRTSRAHGKRRRSCARTLARRRLSSRRPSAGGASGDWEASATGNYAQVWAADETNPCYASGNVEPTTAVLDRSTAFIVDLERRYSGRDILLFSHGDTLQILQAGFLRMNPSQHRSLPELKNAEIRRLRLPARGPIPAPLLESGGQQPV